MTFTASNGVRMFPDELLPHFLVVEDKEPPYWRKTRHVLNARELDALKEYFTRIDYETPLLTAVNYLNYMLETYKPTIVPDHIRVPYEGAMEELTIQKEGA